MAPGIKVPSTDRKSEKEQMFSHYGKRDLEHNSAEFEVLVKQQILFAI